MSGSWHAGSRVALVLTAVLALASAGCGGSKKTSPASLKNRLLPASQVPGFKLHRSYEWANSIDLVGQGIPLPQSTAPSTAVKVVDKAGFEAAAGEELTKGHEEAGLGVLVAKLKSDKDARRLADYVHDEGRKLPCYATCSEQTADLNVTGIPGARGVKQTPAAHPPPDAPPPFAAYGVGFTIGPYFYLVAGGGPPNFKSTIVVSTAQKLYSRVAKL